MSNCPPDIAVVVVTCEPGGNAEIESRLADRETPNLRFPVISDPEHKLVSRPKEAVFVEKMMHASKYATPRTQFVDYPLLQPALLVLDSSGNVEQCWSWKTMGAEKYLGEGDTLESAEMVKVDADGDARTQQTRSADYDAFARRRSKPVDRGRRVLRGSQAPTAAGVDSEE